MYRPGCPGPVLSINLITGGKFAFPVKPVPLHTWRLLNLALRMEVFFGVYGIKENI